MQKSDEKQFYLVAVSGGPDSMALLDMLYNQKINLIAVHVNYKTRDASDYETELVGNYCKAKGIIFEYKIIDYYKKGNFQDFARKERYTFFKEVYDRYHTNGLYVAHHLDDALETFIMQLRKKSIVEDYGIAMENEIFGMKVIRPLLNYSKKELLEYCKNNKIDYSIDISNLQSIYTRNAIRNDELTKLDQQTYIDLIKKMKKFQEDNKIIKLECLNILKEISNESGLSIPSFLKLELSYQIRILYYFIKDGMKNEVCNLSYRRLCDWIIKLKSLKPNIYLIINQKFVLKKEYDYLKIGINNNEYEYLYIINNNKEKLINKWFIISNKGNKKEEIIACDNDYPLTIRNYHDKDIIMTKNGHKMVRRLFIDKKIPLSQRKTFPVVLNKNGLIILIPALYQNYLNNNLQTGQFVIKLSSDT